MVETWEKGEFLYLLNTDTHVLCWNKTNWHVDYNVNVYINIEDADIDYRQV